MSGQRLVDATGESAAYHVSQGEVRLCLYRVDSPHPIRDHIKAGDVLPITNGTGGRILCAFDPVRYENATPEDRKYYDEIRVRGYHAAAGDRLDEVAGIAAPVFNREGRVVAALTLSMPRHRYNEAYSSLVVAGAERLSQHV